MASERILRQIDRFLDEAEEAVAQGDWSVVSDRADKVLALDPDNADARTYLAAAHRAQGDPGDGPAPPSGPAPASPSAAPVTAAVTGQIEVTSWVREGQTDHRLNQLEEAMRA